MKNTDSAAASAASGAMVALPAGVSASRLAAEGGGSGPSGHAGEPKAARMRRATWMIAVVALAIADLARLSALWIGLTALAACAIQALRLARAAWQQCGARIVRLDAREHDAIFAAVSHLPHVLSYAIIRGIFQQHNGADLMALGGPGFRDFSRIAASDPVVWRDILTTNREQVLLQISHFKDALNDFEQAIQLNNPQALEDMIRQASDLRFNWRMGANKSSEE